MNLAATLHRSITAISIGLVCHASYPLPVAAQTPEWLKQNAAKANDDLFKPSPSDLYTDDGNGNLSVPLQTLPDEKFNQSDLYYGVDQLDAASNALPDERSYDDFFIYRDSRIGDMESGRGVYGQTAPLNAEANAAQVLRSSENIPGIRSESFLFTSEGIISDGAAIKGEFGECVQVRKENTETISYDDFTEERCESMGYDSTPLMAERQYFGPSSYFKYGKDANGNPTCSFGKNTIRVDGPDTCATLSSLTAIPLVDYASSCGTACVVMTMRPKRDYKREPHYTIDGNVTELGYYLRARVKFGAYPIRDVYYHPGDGDCSNDDPAYQDCYIDKEWMVYWDGKFVGRTDSHTDLDVESSDGYTYEIHPAENFLLPYFRGVTRQLTNPLIDSEMKATFRVRKSAEVLSASAKTTNFGIGTTLKRNGSLVATADGIFPQPVMITPVNVAHTFLAARAGGLDPDATVQITMSFAPKTFSDWTYNTARWEELKGYVDMGFCTLDWKVEKTASKSDGCVPDIVGGATPGKLCGAEIPVSPFTGSPDRGAIKLKITPDCKRPQKPPADADGDYDDLYATDDNCGTLRDAPECSFVSRSCIDQLPSGGCYTFEEVYSCGQTKTYTVPTTVVENVCTSSLSCLGDDCTIDTSTDATADLATAAAKLSSVDMALSDMQCTSDPKLAKTETEAQAAYDTCQIFQGDRSTCGRVALGLSNCCNTPRGVSLYDYLMLAFSVSRLNANLTSLGFETPITSAWATIGEPLRDSYTELTRPLVEVWESVIGNSDIAKTAAKTVSLEAIKQQMMQQMAQWTADIFGVSAANSLFSVNAGTAFSATGQLNPGTLGFSASAQTVLSAVSIAFTVYTIINVLSALLFRCSASEIELGVKRSLKSTHYIGTYCSKKVLGACLKRKDSYCVFNSPLSRIMIEQIRLQQGKGWGSPERPDCSGVTIGDLATVDMESIDLSEWTGMLLDTEILDLDRVKDIDAMTGSTSTLGKALGDLYPRENAIDRNTNRFEDVDTPTVRKDALDDFGRHAVAP